MEFKEVKTEQDIDCLQELIQEIWPEVFIPIIGKEQVDYMLVHYQGKDVVISDMRNGVKYFIVVADDGNYAGYFAYSFEEDNLSISKLYLKKDFRGLGISSKIFLLFEQAAKENGREKLFLHVNRYNKSAVELYLYKGFEIVKTIDTPLGDKFFLTDYWMEKKIKS